MNGNTTPGCLTWDWASKSVEHNWVCDVYLCNSSHRDRNSISAVDFITLHSQCEGIQTDP